jgi:ATP-dependent DNA helicase MPH1
MEVSIEKCYSYFKAIEEGAEPEEGAKSNGKKTQRDKGLLNNPLTKEVIQALEAQKDKGFSHPKIEQTRNLLVQYFGAQDEAENSTKAMIFTTLRQCVDEIVENLRDMQPLIRVSRFVGQSQDVKGNKGMAQKEQKQVCYILLII